MKRMPPAILLFLSLFLLILNQTVAIAASIEPYDSPAREEERTSRLLSPITETDSIQNEQPPLVVVQQKGSGKEDPVQERPDEQKGFNAEEKEEEAVLMADPLRPWNKAMFLFNDKLYFWVLKPVTLGYTYIAPEPLRMILNNFFDNLKAPGRFVNNLLQLKMKAAGNESVRFVFNSTAGLGGLADAAKDLLHIQKSPADFGQTLGYYGIGHGFYLVWPMIGPSSPRDTVGYIGDRILYPLSYLSFTEISLEASSAIFVIETVNETSFRIGDYEAFKEAAIDPYASLRDAYFQNRKKAVEK
jgi:phospholipid-binding lipoprotein MlaA